MARLFITPREMNFISDLTKEIIKDVNGQVIYYYSVSEAKTKTHDVYNEAFDKIYDQPIALDAFVDAQFQEDTKINSFGVDQSYKLEVFVQYRDLIDKNMTVNIGDYFSFSDIFYEITNVNVLKNIYGQAEHHDGVRILGTKVRDSQFVAKLRGPTGIQYTDVDAKQKTFTQQRGEAEINGVLTGDRRELIEQEILDMPLTGHKEVSERGALADDSHYESAFYDEVKE